MEDNGDNSLQRENDLFYFESDHVALRGNKDYSELMKTLVILTAQREQALKDIQAIREMKTSALEDPESFLTKLKKNELAIPSIQTMAQVPFIDWYAYDVKIPEEELKAIYSDKSTGRGETLNVEKPSQNKKLWTSEEQKRLEELLIKYPEEPIESRRHRKIANELKTRTEQQVASRLQKYYQKMAKAGIPVNGKVSKSSNYKKRNRHKHGMWKPTTFFPQYNVSVHMDETESVPGPSSGDHSKPSTSNSPPNYLLSSDYHQPKFEQTETTECDMQMELLKRIELEKRRETEQHEPYRHSNFRCNYCNQEPILGTRWHCSTCKQNSIDFCTDCLLSQLYSETSHPTSHRFVTLPHPDNSNNNMSSDSDSDSTNGNSNNISDSDASAYSSVQSVNSKKNVYVNENSHERNGRKMDRDSMDDQDNNTSDIGYAYLHSNLSFHKD